MMVGELEGEKGLKRKFQSLWDWSLPITNQLLRPTLVYSVDFPVSN